MQYNSIKSMVVTLSESLSCDAQEAIKYLFLLYSLQTDSEQKDAHLRTKNNVGFTRNDSKYLTSLVMIKKNTGSLSDDQMSDLHEMLPKYAPQIIKVLLSGHSIEKLRRGCYIW